MTLPLMLRVWMLMALMRAVALNLGRSRAPFKTLSEWSWTVGFLMALRTSTPGRGLGSTSGPWMWSLGAPPVCGRRDR